MSTTRNADKQTVPISMLRRMLSRFKKMEQNYLIAYTEAGPKYTAQDRARYEGIHIGTRWCAEDLAALIEKVTRV